MNFLDQPKRAQVSTWGMFPRPENISTAFGGGRNIRPGQELEPQALTDARAARVKEALARYKTQVGGGDTYLPYTPTCPALPSS